MIPEREEPSDKIGRVVRASYPGLIGQELIEFLLQNSEEVIEMLYIGNNTILFPF